MLRGKKVLLGVTAGIAAYKAAFLCRELIKEGAEVKVILTPAAKDFVTPLTLSTLSKNPVFCEYFDPDNGEWSQHVELAKWSDFLLIAPATANTIAKMANGVCDNFLLAVYQSMEKEVFFAPAMDLDMYQHPANKENFERLKGFGNIMIPAEKGELASGLEGEGRLAATEAILSHIKSQFKTIWYNKEVVVTAGPTYENIDPVRYIGNYSSGKMGYAIAQELVDKGAKVTLISGPTALKPPANLNFFQVVSASEMYENVSLASESANLIIMAAAVADYKPKNVSSKKLKKKDNDLHIELERTTDILKELGQVKKKDQLLVGFALETNHEVENAFSKLERKNLDLIVLNSLNDEGAGFGHNTNRVTFIDKDNKSTQFELKSKQEVAADLINYIAKQHFN